MQKADGRYLCRLLEISAQNTAAKALGWKPKRLSEHQWLSLCRMEEAGSTLLSYVCQASNCLVTWQAKWAVSFREGWLVSHMSLCLL